MLFFSLYCSLNKERSKRQMANPNDEGNLKKASSGEITLPARFSSLESVRKFFLCAAVESGLSGCDIDAVELSVDEAFSNIIEHAYGGESDEMIECSYTDNPSQLRIIIKDCGKPFDPVHVPEPDLDAGLEERRVGGLGLYFMSKLMDEIYFSFVKSPDGKKKCNILTMVKHKEH